MPTPRELETKFWKALKSDRTALLGLSRGGDGHAQPMTAQIEGDEFLPIQGSPSEQDPAPKWSMIQSFSATLP